MLIRIRMRAVILAQVSMVGRRIVLRHYVRDSGPNGATRAFDRRVRPVLQIKRKHSGAYP